MKRGIEVYTDYDVNGRWRLNVQKKRGKLTLEEIRDAAKEVELDYYLLVLDCFHEECFDDQLPEEPVGDAVILYRTDLFYEEGEH